MEMDLQKRPQFDAIVSILQVNWPSLVYQSMFCSAKFTLGSVHQMEGLTAGLAGHCQPEIDPLYPK